MIMSNSETGKQPRPLLGRKFNPIAGAVKRRAALGHSSALQAEVTEGVPAQLKGNLQPVATPKSREAVRGKPKVHEHFTIDKVSKQSACVGTLQEGFAQSYIDLFYLTHGKFESLEVKDSVITSLKDRLVTAEQFFQEGDFSSAFHVYYELGNFFEKQGTFDAATYFYTRCAEIAQKHELFVQESTAFQGLGNCASKTQQIQLAIEMYERGATIAETHSLRDSLIKISKNLTEVYRIEAEKLEEEGRNEEALEIHMKCLESAKNSEDLVAQGIASYRIGLIFYSEGDFVRALENFEAYLEYSKLGRYLDGVTTALAKIAKTHQEMGNVTKAISILEELNLEASENNKQNAEAEASLRLGLLYQKQKQPKQAVDFLSKHFSISMKVQDRSMVDIARVNLGMAKAIKDMEVYAALATSNLSALLQWKLNRDERILTNNK